MNIYFGSVENRGGGMLPEFSNDSKLLETEDPLKRRKIKTRPHLCSNSLEILNSFISCNK